MIYQELSGRAEVVGDFALDTSERSAAAQRLPLVEADVQGMTNSQLAKKLEWALAYGSRTEQFCY